MPWYDGGMDPLALIGKLIDRLASVNAWAVTAVLTLTTSIMQFIPDAWAVGLRFDGFRQQYGGWIAAVWMFSVSAFLVVNLLKLKQQMDRNRECVERETKKIEAEYQKWQDLSPDQLALLQALYLNEDALAIAENAPATVSLKRDKLIERVSFTSRLLNNYPETPVR